MTAETGGTAVRGTAVRGAAAGAAASAAGGAAAPGPAAGADGAAAAGATVGGASDEPSVGELVRDASAQISALLRAEIELAKAELSATAKRAGVGAGFFGAAAVIALLSLPFLFVTLAEVLVAIGLPRWSAYLIVWGLFVVLAAVAAFVGRRMVTRLRKPERTIETVQSTARWARHPTGVAEKSTDSPPPV